MPRARTPLADRLWARVDRSAGEEACWPWLGSLNNKGYGQIGEPGGARGVQRLVQTHRAAYETVHGPVPYGAHVLHKCDTPACCNPSHLFLGTHEDNMRDKEIKGRGNHARGARHASVKLTEEQVRLIRAAPRTPGVCQHFADLYGVGRETVVSVRCRKTWRWVK